MQYGKKAQANHMNNQDIQHECMCNSIHVYAYIF